MPSAPAGFLRLSFYVIGRPFASPGRASPLQLDIGGAPENLTESGPNAGKDEPDTYLEIYVPVEKFKKRVPREGDYVSVDIEQND